MQHFLEIVEYFRPHPESLSERGCTYRTYHELLERNGRIGVGAAVDDVHHGNRQRLGIHPADITVERHAEQVCRRTRTSKRNTEYRIGPEIAFGRSPVELKHRLIDTYLVGNLHSDNFRSNHIVYIGHGFQHALTQVTPLVSVAQLQRLMFTRGGTARNRSTAESTAGRRHLDLYRGIPRESIISLACTLTISDISFIFKMLYNLKLPVTRRGGDNNRTASPNTQNYDIARY